MYEDMKFELAPSEVLEASAIYAKLGDATADDYKHLKMALKRTAACVALGVVKKLTPAQVNDWSDNDDFRSNADALIMAYEITHPDKVGVDVIAADFITDLARQLDHSQCDHGDGEDPFGFHDDSERLTIDDDDVAAKFEDILAGYADTADEPAARPAAFEVGADGEATDQRGSK